MGFGGWMGRKLGAIAVGILAVIFGGAFWFMGAFGGPVWASITGIIIFIVGILSAVYLWRKGDASL